nr:Nucleotidyl transferase and Bacterial transferase hexapeptide repeat domain containing protein [Haemonchus contortus]
MAFKAVVLVGGPQKGTRFRPLSLQLPKPLFPIAGVPLVEHHIDQLSQLPGLSEIILIGSYSSDLFTDFIGRCQQTYRISIKYAQEQQPLGTAGGLVAQKDTILGDSPEALFVINGDVCGDLPVDEMVARIACLPNGSCLLLTTEATREQSGNFGNVVIDNSGRVVHYVDKPTTFVSTHISCGVYLMKPSVIMELKVEPACNLWFETDIFPKMASNGKLFALHTTRWWSQTKTAAAVLYANRHYLRLFKKRYAARLCRDRAQIVGDVFIDPSAEVDKSAKIGPNVSIGPNAKIGKGVRIKESIILADAVVHEHACVLHSVIGWRSVVGAWSRVEGIPIAPNPNLPFAKLENKPLFLSDGRLNPSLTILGSDVSIAPETIVLNCVVLPYKELSCSYKNQIIL